MSDLEFHRIANIYPLMVGADFAELVEDVRSYGVRDAIILFEGKILDGRNRYRAAIEAGRECPRKEWAGDCGDPFSFVQSTNKRRQLTKSQRAMCAARARSLFEEMAKERQKRKPTDSVQANLPEQKQQARDQAGKAFHVSGRYVDYASTIIDKAVTELTQAVDEGRIGLSTAVHLTHRSEDEQRRAASDPGKNRSYKSMGKTLFDSGEEEPEPTQNRREGKGIIIANEAINCLIRIPKNDPDRKRGFQIVTDWIKAQR